MERPSYEVKVIDESFFHGLRDLESSMTSLTTISYDDDLEASVEMVVNEVIDAILQDLDYDRIRMRVGINFTFGDDQSPDRKYYVNTVSYTHLRAHETP